MKAMRLVCRWWKLGFEKSVTKFYYRSTRLPLEQHLRLGIPWLSGVDLLALGNSSLVYLDLDCCGLVSSENLRNLRGLPLTSLSLAWTDVDDSGLSALEGLP